MLLRITHHEVDSRIEEFEPQYPTSKPEIKNKLQENLLFNLQVSWRDFAVKFRITRNI